MYSIHNPRLLSIVIFLQNMCIGVHCTTDVNVIYTCFKYLNGMIGVPILLFKNVLRMICKNKYK